MIRFEAESLEKINKKKSSKKINKRRPRIKTELLKDVDKDLELQRELLGLLCYHSGITGMSAPMKTKENILKALIHKTEVNLELLKLA